MIPQYENISLPKRRLIKMIKEAIHKLVLGQNLETEETEKVMSEIMSGKATNAQISAFLIALRIKGETVEEITACAKVMRDMAVKLNTNGDVLEIVGTGGDEVGTFNISTTSAFVISAGGVTVAKHGNRSVSSKSGAADVLENLGAKITITPEQNEQVLPECGFAFMFAPGYHSSMKYAAPVRREIGIRTIFNVLGPLTNPAFASMQLMGVYDDSLVRPMAKVLKNLGIKSGMVVCGEHKLDEATVTGDNFVCEIKNGEIKEYTINPEALGFKKASLEDIIGGTPAENAQITRDILSGKITDAKRDIVILNSALCFYIAEKVKTIEDGIKFAAEIIDSGRANKQLEKYVSLTNKY